jgi:hypothetical protein
MQTAARKVVEENKMLRIMLNQRGVSSDEINTFLSSPSLATGPQDTPSPVPSVALAGLLKLDTTVNPTRIGQLGGVPAPLNESIATPELLLGNYNTKAAFTTSALSLANSEIQLFWVVNSSFGHQFEGSLVKQEVMDWAY